MPDQVRWRDVTSWSRSDTDRSCPRTWEIKVGFLTVVVTRHIDLGPNEWMIRFSPPILSAHVSVHREVEDSKTEALVIAGKVLSKALQAVLKITEAQDEAGY